MDGLLWRLKRSKRFIWYHFCKNWIGHNLRFRTPFWRSKVFCALFDHQLSQWHCNLFFFKHGNTQKTCRVTMACCASFSNSKEVVKFWGNLVFKHETFHWNTTESSIFYPNNTGWHCCRYTHDSMPEDCQAPAASGAPARYWTCHLLCPPVPDIEHESSNH